MAAATGAYFAGFSFRRNIPAVAAYWSGTKRPAVATERSTVELSATDLVAERKFDNTPEVVRAAPRKKVLEQDEGERMTLRDYFEQAKVLIRSEGGHGPPRWFSPLECGSRVHNSLLLLYLPGIDGVGLGLVLQHRKLGQIFDIWCLHIPVKDRTPFQELVQLVEETVRSKNLHCPDRPIYLVGESIGACLALALAARNPDIDLILILANPATCYNKSQLQSLLPLLEVIPNELSLISPPHTLNLMTGEPFKTVFSTLEKGLELQGAPKQLFEGFGRLSSNISVRLNMISVLQHMLNRLDMDYIFTEQVIRQSDLLYSLEGRLYRESTPLYCFI